ncbi:MAG: hypothetical protein OEW75_18245, partial [Cyclobacteriaceae bacterium]|nr:hypothetical protein [Cyclobacteriaceae bacterium]
MNSVSHVGKKSAFFTIFFIIQILFWSSCIDESIIKTKYPGDHVIDQIMPDSGLVGTLVLINGQNFPAFDPQNPTDSIYINGTLAEPVDGSTTHRLVRVAKGSTSGPLTMVQNGVISASNDFKVLIPEVTTFAGTGVAGLLDGPPFSAEFNGPFDLGWNFNGDLIIVDAFNHSLRYVDPKLLILTYAGTGSAGFVNNKTLLSSSFNSPISVDSDKDLGRLYIADQNNHAIRVIDNGNFVSTFAGSGTAGYADGQGQQASFNSPFDLVV